ncbi:RlmE family RNA methyltransferase [bacterium]|nr:RlmE family RNA methyltransferase [bacterium]
MSRKVNAGKQRRGPTGGFSGGKGGGRFGGGGPKGPWADHHTHKAKQLGFAARSVFKLEEIDKKHKVLAKGHVVLDLGCAPGSWTQYAAKRVGPEGRVVGIDLKETKIDAPNATLLTGDATESLEQLRDLAPGGYDIVLSDMAPSTTGIKDVDEARSQGLVESALATAEALLKPGGAFVAKLFYGPDAKALIERIGRHFASTQTIRPDATRKQSREVFILAQGFRPAANDAPDDEV